MRENAKVVSVSGKFAKVSIEKKSNCDKCGMCIFPKNSSTVEFQTLNKANATVGDEVVIETRENSKLIAMLFVFLIPLILLGAGVFLGIKLINNDLITVALCLVLLVLWYTILALIDKKFAKIGKLCPVIVETVKKEN